MDPVPFAVAAGMLAAVNPCGFALLPAYLSLFTLGPVDAPRRTPRRAVVQALIATLAMTLGFVAVFAAFGLALTSVASALIRWLPTVTVVIGLALVGAGGYLLAGRSLTLHVPFLRLTSDPVASPLTMVGYGIAYAVASLGCTIGPFLAVTATTFTAGDIEAGVVAYLAYAGGMGIVVGVLAVAAALASDAMITRIRSSQRWLDRITGGLLVLVGLYVAWYGAYELRVYGGADAADPVIEAAGRVQNQLSSWINSTPPAAWAGLVALAAIVAAVGWLSTRRR